MEKRYQVFISSTFEDLKTERQNIIKAVLEIDHFPAGMELFPASDSDAWGLIKDVIDASDYYVLVIGGRYGSIGLEGISYTEQEYDYAKSRNKPVIPLLHKNPDNLPRKKIETDTKAWQKLSSFRKKVEKAHTCTYWENADELKALLIVGLTKTIKSRPAVGWVRSDNMPSQNALKEILELKKANEALEKKLASEATSAPIGTEDLQQGDDIFKLECRFVAVKSDSPAFAFLEETTNYKGTIRASWNEIWAAISPSLMQECTTQDLNRALTQFVTNTGKSLWEDTDDLEGKVLRNFKVDISTFETVLVQYRALGLLKESTKQRSVRDKSTYWSLTPYGDSQLMKLRAIRKKKKKMVIKADKAVRDDSESEE